MLRKVSALLCSLRMLRSLWRIMSSFSSVMRVAYIKGTAIIAVKKTMMRLAWDLKTQRLKMTATLEKRMPKAKSQRGCCFARLGSMSASRTIGILSCIRL